jgi:hypothetical protein
VAAKVSDFDAEFVQPSIERRRALKAAGEELPRDVWLS